MKRSHSNTRLARSRCLPTLKPSTRVVPVGGALSYTFVVARRSWDGRPSSSSPPSPLYFLFFTPVLSILIRRMTFFICSNVAKGSCKSQSARETRATLAQLGKEWNEDLWREVRVELDRDHVYRFTISSLPLQSRVGQIEYLAIDSVN